MSSFYFRYGWVAVLLVLSACTFKSEPMPPAAADTAVLRDEPTPMVTFALPATAAVSTPTPQPTMLPTATSPPTPTPSATPVPYGTSSVIGFSTEGRPLLSYQFGNGPATLIFIGGIHGGYEWNTILLAYEAIDYFKKHRDTIPPDVTLYIIPSANPDGQFLVTGRNGRFSADEVAEETVPGRFNANNVDLNRNWNCQWVETAVWRDQEVSGGEFPFSERETVILRDYILAQAPAAVVFWHSAVDGVFPGHCPDLYPPSLALANVYSDASGYPVYERFTRYPVTGDAGDWLATQGIAAVSVELKTHEALDWEQNLAGMLAVLNHYGTIPP